MAPNFASLLNKPTDDVKKPEPLPDGTYFGVVKSHELLESSQKKTPFVRYHVEATEPDPDTDAEGVEVAGKKLKVDFYITDESTYRLTEFIASLGVDIAGRTLGEIIPQATGQTIMLDVVKKPNQDGTAYFNEIRKATGLATPDEAPEVPESEQIAEAQGRRRRG